MNKGRIWPYAIGAAITLVFGFCVATIVITESSAIQESDVYMTKYQVADLNANEYIQKRIEFDKLYDVVYITQSIGGESPVISYKITTKDGKSVSNAKIKIALSRPETDKYDKDLQEPKVKDGVYSFSVEKFPKAGVWNIIAKIDIDDKERFLNIKADTRAPYSFEF
ncbi:MAG: FixH family protein [Sulfurimonas sp.]|nr:FixH family protein [Sulfurimonas sp.]MDQ7067562.1 FixH family protein [Sulfurimonas sp.]